MSLLIVKLKFTVTHFWQKFRESNFLPMSILITVWKSRIFTVKIRESNVFITTENTK